MGMEEPHESAGIGGCVHVGRGTRAEGMMGGQVEQRAEGHEERAEEGGVEQRVVDKDRK